MQIVYDLFRTAGVWSLGPGLKRDPQHEYYYLELQYVLYCMNESRTRRMRRVVKLRRPSEARILSARSLSCDALEQWIGDQLRMGLSAFVDDVTARCRRIAARLVDGKAAQCTGGSTNCRAGSLRFHRATGHAARWSNSASWCCSHAPSAPHRATPRSGARSRPRKRARPYEQSRNAARQRALGSARRTGADTA